MVVVVSLGLAAALVYGGSDYLGGFAAGSLSALRVTLVAFLAGLVVTLAFLPIVASAWTVPALGYGAIAGAAAAVSIWLLYACLAIGPVSVLAPLVALIAALMPVAYGLFRHERISVIGKIALGAVLIAAVLVGSAPGGRGVRVQSRALLLGVAAGLATGGYLIALDFTPPGSGAVPVVVVFAAGSILLAVAAATGAAWRRFSPASRPRAEAPTSGSPPDRSVAWTLSLISGATQAVADVCVIVGIHRGHLAVMAALMALYPLGTIALARLVSHERPTTLQVAGILLAILATVSLSIS
jgi:drug/metabolite transporter (DMT)-like permease